jgi:Motility quorum-sensing regulator, toxin of MqsA
MQPTFSLPSAIGLASLGKVTITQVAIEGAGVHGYSAKEIIECFSAFVLEEDFFKTMRSVTSGGMLDVYRCTYKNIDWYVKFAVDGDVVDGGMLHIVSFKESGKSALPCMPRKSENNRRTNKNKVPKNKINPVQR